MCLASSPATRISRRIRLGSTGLSAVLAASFVFGQPLLAEPLSLSVGEGELYPEITISYVGNDNVFATRDNMQEAAGLLVQPRLSYVADKGQNAVSLSYGGSYLNSEESSASFADHRLRLEGRGLFSKRSRARASLSFDVSHDDAGGRLSRGNSAQLSEPYAYNQFLFDTRYTYGASSARGNLSVGLRARSLDHTNEPDPNRPQRTDGLDFTKVIPYLIFSVRLAGDTRGFLDLRFGNADYDAFSNPATPQLDHTDFRAYVGTSWEFTGRTGGSVGVGLIDIDYSESALEDDQLIGLDLDAFYEFTSYSKLEIGVRREQDSTTDNTLLGREDIITLLWGHEWSSRLKSEIGLASTTNFGVCVVGETSNERKFTENELQAAFTLQIRRWLAVSLGVEVTDESADNCSTSTVGTYEQNQVLASVKVTL